jgi:hypothetical protein
VSPLRFFGPHPPKDRPPHLPPLQWCRFCRRPFGPLSAASHGHRLALGEGEPRSTFARSAITAVTPAAQRLWDPAHAARISNCGPACCGAWWLLTPTAAPGGVAARPSKTGDLSRFAMRRLRSWPDRSARTKPWTRRSAAAQGAELLRELRAGAIDGDVSALGCDRRRIAPSSAAAGGRRVAPVGDRSNGDVSRAERLVLSGGWTNMRVCLSGDSRMATSRTRLRWRWRCATSIPRRSAIFASGARADAIGWRRRATGRRPASDAGRAQGNGHAD